MIVMLAMVSFLVAQAAPEVRQSRTELGIDTQFPLSVGVVAMRERPSRVRLSGGVGFVPEAYAETINSVALAVNGYDQQTGVVVEQLLTQAPLVNLGVGWRPFGGLVLTTGYQAIWLAADSVSLGVDVPDQAGIEASEVQVQSALHMATVALRWEASLAPHVRLHFSVGTAATLAADTSVRAESALSGVERAALTSSENELDQLLEERIHTPTLGMGMAYRF